MKPEMKTAGLRAEGSGLRVKASGSQQETQAPIMPARERANETTLQFDESIGCYRWGVKGKD